jgi:hypothetical protein
MFGAEFYVELVNAEFASQLSTPIDTCKLNLKIPRILVSLEQYICDHPLKSGQFHHYRPARYFNENIKELTKKIPDDVKKRFADAFDALNALLK